MPLHLTLEAMPLHPTWEDIALRLVLTMIAGGIIGLNRGVRGEAAALEQRFSWAWLRRLR